jgi:hypothetical protein
MITLSNILNIAEYEKQRPIYRQRVIEAKKNRRISVGPIMTFVFENRDTVLFQIQEMVRTERLVFDEHIQHEIDTYNRLLPTHNELSATLLIEITEKEAIRSTLDSLVGLTKDSIYLMIGDRQIDTIFDEEQSEEASSAMRGRISAVQYVRWTLGQDDIEHLRSGDSELGILTHHPNYHHFTRLTNDQREAIVKDLSE